MGTDGPASTEGASARQGTSPYLADRDIRDLARFDAPRARARSLELVPDPSNTLLGSFHSRSATRRTPTDPGETGLLALLTDFVTGEIARYGYVAIFVLMLLESACIPIPSEVTMLFGGALVTAPFLAPEQQLEFWLVVLAGTLGNLVGSWLAYWAGYSGGRPLIDRWGRYLLIRPHEVDRAHEWFERRGQAAVFFGRLLPVIRTFISLPAGVVRMNFWRFTVYTVLGCLPWVLALTWIGALLGERWDRAEAIIRPFAWAIAIALALAVAWFVWHRVRQIRREEAARVGGTGDRSTAGVVEGSDED